MESSYERLIKRANEKGFSEPDVTRRLSQKISDIHLKAEKAGYTWDELATRLQSKGVPATLVAPQDKPPSVVERIKEVGEKGLAGLKEPAGKIAKTLKEIPKKAPKKLAQITDLPDLDPVTKAIVEGGIKAGTQLADEQLEMMVGPAGARGVKNVVAGMVSTAGGFGGMARAAGLEDIGAAISRTAEIVHEELTPPDPKFIDQVAQGFGSMATFMIPGFGIQAGAARLALFSTRLASWMGVGAAAIMESATESGFTYN